MTDREQAVSDYHKAERAALAAGVEPWRFVWREGIAPGFSRAELQSLRDALAHDDPRLVQGATTTPPPLPFVQDWPCQGGCFLTFPAFLTPGVTVGAAEQRFADLCVGTDERLNCPTAVRHFLNQFDRWPRDEMRANLLPEVELALAARPEGGGA